MRKRTSLPRRDIELAVESKLIEYGMFCDTENALSSRVTADEIVEIVFKMLAGQKNNIKKPWAYYSVNKKERVYKRKR